MAKVGLDLSFTFRIGPNDRNQFAKINVSVTEIDTEIPTEPQIDRVDQALEKIWSFSRKFADGKIEEILEAE